MICLVVFSGNLNIKLFQKQSFCHAMLLWIFVELVASPSQGTYRQKNQTKKTPKHSLQEVALGLKKKKKVTPLVQPFHVNQRQTMQIKKMFFFLVCLYF